MTANLHPADTARKSGYVVRPPLATDALGHALRGVFDSTPLPEDMAALIKRLDRVTH